MDHPINAAYFFRFTCPDCGFENMAPTDEFAVSFLNVNLDGSSVQAAYAGRQLPPKLSKLFQEPAAWNFMAKSRDYCVLTKCFSSDRRDQIEVPLSPHDLRCLSPKNMAISRYTQHGEAGTVPSY